MGSESGLLTHSFQCYCCREVSHTQEACPKPGVQMQRPKWIWRKRVVNVHVDVNKVDVANVSILDSVGISKVVLVSSSMHADVPFVLGKSHSNAHSPTFPFLLFQKLWEKEV